MMARQRMIHPELWDNAQISALGDFEFRVYIGLISWADDEGRVDVNPVIVCARLFPLRNGLSVETVRDAIVALEARRLIGMYQVGERTFAFHPHWEKWQTICRPSKSKIPTPPGPESYASARKQVKAHGYKCSPAAEPQS